MVNIIWMILVVFALWFIYILIIDFVKHKDELENVSWIKTGLIGFVVIF